MASPAVLGRVEDAPQGLQAARKSAASLQVPVDLDRIAVQFVRYRFSLIHKLVEVREALLAIVGLALVKQVESSLTVAVYLT